MEITKTTVLEAITARQEKGNTEDGIAWDLDLSDSPANIKAIRKVLSALRKEGKISRYVHRQADPIRYLAK